MIKDGGAVCRELPDGGDLDRRLVCGTVVPLLLLSLAVVLLVRLRCRLLLLRLRLDSLRLRGLAHDLSLGWHLALIADHLRLLLLDGAGGMKRISCCLSRRRVRVEAILSGWASP